MVEEAEAATQTAVREALREAAAAHKQEVAQLKQAATAAAEGAAAGHVADAFTKASARPHTWCTPTPCHLPLGALLIPCTMCGAGECVGRLGHE